MAAQIALRFHRGQIAEATLREVIADLGQMSEIDRKATVRTLKQTSIPGHLAAALRIALEQGDIAQARDAWSLLGPIIT